MMRRPRWALLAALSFVACAPTLPVPRTGEHGGEQPLVVLTPPPPGRVEVVPPRPRELKHPVWVDGEWEWVGRRWVWKERGWQDEPPGAYYAPPVTKRQPDGRLLHFPGTWKKDEPAGP